MYLITSRVLRPFVQMAALGIALAAGLAAAAEPSGYLCCNLHYNGDWISDMNYGREPYLAAGTPAAVTGYGRYRVYVTIDGKPFRFGLDYGRRYETLEQHAARLVVANDPKVLLASYPPAVQEAIRAGKVARGMTREQVLMGLGQPVLGYTASLKEPVWRYWLSRREEFQVHFGDDGGVRDITGDAEVLKFAVLDAPVAKPRPRIREQVVLLPAATGAIGAVVLRTGGEERVLDKPYAVAEVVTGEPVAVRTATAEEVKGIAGEALRGLPPKPESFILHFDLARDQIRPGDEAVIDRIVAAIKARDVPDVSIVGHADRTGDAAYNRALSQRRAEAVYQRILARGGKGQIEVVGKGDTENVVAHSRRVPEQRNRRVEVHVR